MNRRRIAASVITGFLGSGKTTLLSGLLERDPARDRIAVIVNELGEIGIDGRVLTGFEFIENIVELASGCVCCSIDEYRFDLAIDELVRRVDPQLVVLETTGVADPEPTLERLRRSGLGVDSVVTVVDAMSWGIASRVSGAARRQIAAADFLVISKGDVAGPSRVQGLRRQLARRNSRATIFESCGRADFPGSDMLLATSAARAAAASASGVNESSEEDVSRGRGSHDAAHRSGHLRDERFESFSWRTDRVVERAALERTLAGLPADILRAKGFVRSPGERVAYLFQLVCGRLEMTGLDLGAPSRDGGAEGVFIGKGILAHRDRVLADLAACEVERRNVEAPVVEG